MTLVCFFDNNKAIIKCLDNYADITLQYRTMTCSRYWLIFKYNWHKPF